MLISLGIFGLHLLFRIQLSITKTCQTLTNFFEVLLLKITGANISKNTFNGVILDWIENHGTILDISYRHIS